MNLSGILPLDLLLAPLGNATHTMYPIGVDPRIFLEAIFHKIMEMLGMGNILNI